MIKKTNKTNNEKTDFDITVSIPLPGGIGIGIPIPIPIKRKLFQIILPVLLSVFLTYLFSLLSKLIPISQPEPIPTPTPTIPEPSPTETCNKSRILEPCRYENE